jgi:hypothetical protein
VNSALLKHLGRFWWAWHKLIAFLKYDYRELAPIEAPFGTPQPSESNFKVYLENGGNCLVNQCSALHILAIINSEPRE